MTEDSLYDLASNFHMGAVQPAIIKEITIESLEKRYHITEPKSSTYLNKLNEVNTETMNLIYRIEDRSLFNMLESAYSIDRYGPVEFKIYSTFEMRSESIKYKASLRLKFKIEHYPSYSDIRYMHRLTSYKDLRSDA